MIQGSEEWLRARLGKVTASRFKDVMTASKVASKLSVKAQSYLMELVAETLTGETKSFSSTACEWGTDNEPKAKAMYEFSSGNTVVEDGLIMHPTHELIGASPDGLIGEDGGVEIKCPYNTANHLATVLSGEMPKEHIAQVQGCMYVTGRKWWDFVSYDPRVKTKSRYFCVRVERDDAYIEKLRSALATFTVALEVTIKDLT